MNDAFHGAGAMVIAGRHSDDNTPLADTESNSTDC